MILRFRSWLFTKSFRATNIELKNVPILTFTDIFYLPIIGWRNMNDAINFLKKLHIFQKKLKTQSWSSLSKYYPRSLYLWYYYQLFWWADYCEVTSDVLIAPDYSLVPELFIRYIVAIDELIDNGDSKTIINEIASVKNNQSVKEILTELINQIEISGVPSKAKKALYHRMWTFRQTSLIACKVSINRQNSDLKSILVEKDRTAGNLFRVWSELLKMLYPVKSCEIANSAREILGNIAMAIQVLDDMLDLPIDYQKNVSNLFYELLKENPYEMEIAIRHVEKNHWKHLDWRWAKKNLPKTCNKAFRLIKVYLDRAAEVSMKPGITNKLCRMVTVWSRNALEVKEALPVLTKQGTD